MKRGDLLLAPEGHIVAGDSTSGRLAAKLYKKSGFALGFPIVVGSSIAGDRLKAKLYPKDAYAAPVAPVSAAPTYYMLGAFDTQGTLYTWSSLTIDFSSAPPGVTWDETSLSLHDA